MFKNQMLWFCPYDAISVKVQRTVPKSHRASDYDVFEADSGGKCWLSLVSRGIVRSTWISALLRVLVSVFIVFYTLIVGRALLYYRNICGTWSWDLAERWWLPPKKGVESITEMLIDLWTSNNIINNPYSPPPPTPTPAAPPLRSLVL
jgi:hypothetical protein